VVSALNRALPAEDGRTVIEQLIPVNTAIYSPSGAFAGVGFAVPVDTVNRVVPQLIAKGKYVAAGIRSATSGPDGKIIPGDIITAVDGKPVRLTVQRDGKEQEIQVVLKAGA
jgi:S1-C subfamily serine protease